LLLGKEKKLLLAQQQVSVGTNNLTDEMMLISLLRNVLKCL